MLWDSTYFLIMVALVLFYPLPVMLHLLTKQNIMHDVDVEVPFLAHFLHLLSPVSGSLPIQCWCWLQVADLTLTLLTLWLLSLFS